ncbi:DUF4232 domain-containing protein [Streptomyces marincola]|uniref:DUF4232 domain-containing protein n=1 Tax=Streptomyces marincola TaxID=2878388 RepID=A0A1W7D4A0_9ACTN|nr:DUF4232 domain-containing protein [Streptomyces marincola]ARQ71846.1 hypothetical protein CAG99_26140 [Streptomyces marincola]
MTSHPARTAVAAAIAVLIAAGCSASEGSDEPARSSDAAPADGSAAGSGRETGQDSAAAGPADDTPDSTPEDTDDARAPQEADGAREDAAAPESRPAWCSPDALTAAVRALEPAAGHRYAALVLTNTSDASCRTQGWPGLQLTTGEGDELPTTTVRDQSTDARALTVEPGGSAWARLHWSTVPGDQDPADGDCGPAPAGLAVIPPDTRSATSTGWDLGSVCGAGRIEAQPLAAGSGPGH